MRGYLTPHNREDRDMSKQTTVWLDGKQYVIRGNNIIRVR
ncbi:hypothetical protein [Mycobacterium phage PP]|uniref:Uncharacterized protein n=1 Tax=Mycobacterium phage PP TaxID=2077134 RepID=A0A2Z5XVC8_9CAUD|nr:hypothetical protein KIW36_gp09 [Mycobacterium phage PP]BBC53803.1 hypothetical protein [Mycobacterium phage PP]